MNKITTDKLPDMQKTQTGFYKKGIEKVGVRNILSYIPIKMKDGSIQKALATISSYCSLDENTKGINMSRITRTINKVLAEDSSGDGFRDLERFVKELKEAHQSPDIYIKAKFQLILNDKSPMSDLYSPEPINIVIESQFRDNEYKTFLTVETVEMSLCPCSKTMSMLINNITSDEATEIHNLSDSLQSKLQQVGYGAHNQKSFIKATIELLPEKTLWIEDLRNMIQNSSSCPSFSVLKRNDEKFVTEVSYSGGYIDDDKVFVKVEGNYGPKFVEDIIRDLSRHLDNELDKTINDYVLVCNNQESIHSGDIQATSILSAGRNLK